ncbi:hypothetical protein H4R34_004310 [Dimargaris verticillata]|uniref:Proteasome assembly chaperone 2 n=1 Tax=Dimargaris verticillata TaxID=2761393 RepID=A0A9W8B0U5_9FUNG|nr:hypothetical protein H4R34_004310 [Dimargaris verticillata]
MAMPSTVWTDRLEMVPVARNQPSVSLGNVPQLCCDLLISTLQLVPVGYLDDPCVTPVVGPPAYAHTKGTMSTCLEVFQSSDKALTVVQQRAPLLRGQLKPFVDNMVQFMADAQFSQVLLLSTIDARVRNDSQLSGSSFRILATNHTPAAFLAQAEKLGVPHLENELVKEYPKDPSHLSRQGLQSSFSNTTQQLATEYSHLSLKDQLTNATGSTKTPRIPGGGIARNLHQMAQRHQLPLTVLLEFVAEGDNIPESILMANCVNGLLNVLTTIDGAHRTGGLTDWVAPPSWHSIYSTKVPQELYQ